MEKLITEEIKNGKGIPLIWQFAGETTIADFVNWHKENKTIFEQKLLQNGAILLKGLNINSSERLQTVMQQMYPNPRKFLDGNSSRGKFTADVYNASEYDTDSIIQLHTEFSYSNIWPAIICFCCATKADKGGETTIGDCKSVITLLDPEIVAEFSAKGITYTRNLHGGNGFGPSWKEAFESEDKGFIEDYCKQNTIGYIWKKNDLRLIQTRPAVRCHPITKDRLWFNQVDQFYPRIYGEEVFDTLLSLAGGIPDNMPMYARYGDGSEIQKEYIEAINKVLDQVTIPVNWEVGDFLIVDNMLYLHGRLPFTGKRKILVSMA